MLLPHLLPNSRTTWRLLCQRITLCVSMDTGSLEATVDNSTTNVVFCDEHSAGLAARNPRPVHARVGPHPMLMTLCYTASSTFWRLLYATLKSPCALWTWQALMKLTSAERSEQHTS